MLCPWLRKLLIRQKKKLQYNEQYYSILFILCSTQLSNTARLKIIRNHKSNAERKFNAKKRRLGYANMESTVKKQHLLQRVGKYKCMEFAKKEKELSRLRTKSQTWYNSMNCTEKEERLSRMRSNSQTWYDSMNVSEKQDRLSNMRTNSQTWYNSMNDSEKQDRLLNMRTNSQTWYSSFNASEKQDRLSDMRNNSQTWYNSMNTSEKQDRLLDMRNNSQTWYNSMNTSEKQDRLSDMRNNSQTWYNSMNTSEKQERLSDMRSNSQTLYNMLNPAEKIKCLSNMQAVSRNLHHSRREKQFDLDYCMKLFQSKIREGPYFICSVCNRLLYRKTVILVQESKYNIQHLFTGKKSFDEKEYICKTCHSKLLKHQNYHVKLCTIICK